MSGSPLLGRWQAQQRDRAEQRAEADPGEDRAQRSRASVQAVADECRDHERDRRRGEEPRDEQQDHQRREAALAEDVAHDRGDRAPRVSAAISSRAWSRGSVSGRDDDEEADRVDAEHPGRAARGEQEARDRGAERSARPAGTGC